MTFKKEWWNIDPELKKLWIIHWKDDEGFEHVSAATRYSLQEHLTYLKRYWEPEEFHLISKKHRWIITDRESFRANFNVYRDRWKADGNIYPYGEYDPLSDILDYITTDPNEEVSDFRPKGSPTTTNVWFIYFKGVDEIRHCVVSTEDYDSVIKWINLNFPETTPRPYKEKQRRVAYNGKAYTKIFDIFTKDGDRLEELLQYITTEVLDETDA